VVEIAGCKGFCLFVNSKGDRLHGSDTLETFDAERWDFECDDVVGEEEEGEVVDEAEQAVEGRRCITVFTVTRLVSFEVGNNGGVALALVSARKFRPLGGMGGMMRALYMVLWILEASDFVF